MPTPTDPILYANVSNLADIIYNKPSAFKSGFIVKKYKDLGGRYREDGNPRDLNRWFKEGWHDIGHSAYPVFRPSKIISEKTPLTAKEIKPANLKKQIKLKQKIKGDANLPPFIKK
jgi:hypothetical protein